jgi:hypothetical protein
MALHFSGGIGIIYDKEIEQPIAKVSYQLIETDPTKYTKKKWWGDFYTSKEVKRTGIFRIELEDGRSGECVVWTDTEIKQDSASHYHYHFNGRSKLSRNLRWR